MHCSYSWKLKTMLLFLSACLIVRSDLPVHCLKTQIAGKWQVFLEAPSLKGMGPLPCGHSIPDDKDTSYQAYNDRFSQSTNFNVILQTDNSVIDAQKSFYIKSII